MTHIGTKPLETERLLLRLFSPDDADAMFANWANDIEVTRWMRWEPHPNATFTRALLEDWCQNYIKEDYYHWAIIRKSDSALVGSIGILSTIEPSEPAGFEPGYCIGRAFWNQGYTTEALKAAVDYFIQGTGTDTLYCAHAIGNPASGRVMQKAGFVYDHDGFYYKPNGNAIPAKYYILHAGKTNG